MAPAPLQAQISDSSLLHVPQALFARRSQRSVAAPLPTWEEQGLCIGATFVVRVSPVLTRIPSQCTAGLASNSSPGDLRLCVLSAAE